MSYLYSPSTGSCYILEMHPEIPVDAVEISDELFKSVIGNRPAGKVIAHLPDGTPYLVDREKSAEEIVYEERSWRDSQLARSEWLVNRHRDEADMQASRTLTDSEFSSLLVYRQELRALPEQEGFPQEGARPVMPEWLAILAG